MQNRFFMNFFHIISVMMLCLTANSYILIKSTGNQTLTIVCVIAFLLINIFPSFLKKGFPSLQLRLCYHGAECLRRFLPSMLIGIFYHIVLAFYLIPSGWKEWGISALVCFFVEFIIFWNGIIAVYISSIQLGIRHRLVGLICGWIPIVHFFALDTIIKTVLLEVDFEMEKAEINRERFTKQICKTKYPVLLVHGVFFRDYKHLNYWGRIPNELKQNGAEIYYGNHQSAASIEDSARELTVRIKEIVENTGCNKINIIAHSKGGLDCRYAISCMEAAPYVASLTTINTPHRGCIFADYLLNKIPLGVQQNVALAYNTAMRKLGDVHPDFMAAVKDLTASRSDELNAQMPDVSDIFYQSVGSKLNRAINGKFPLNFSYHMVKYFDGENDGLVSEKSFPWGENHTYLKVAGRRGISHGDMIDLNRENIPGFDVREFYVNLLSNLKQRGL